LLLKHEPFFQNESLDLSSSRQLLSTSSPELLRQPLLFERENNGGYLEDDDDAFQPAHGLPQPSTEQQIQKKTFVTYENERIWVGIWTTKLFPGERSNWSDINGAMHLPKESFSLPTPANGGGKEWEWEDIWHVEKIPEFTDANGWQYAVDFNSNFHGHKNLLDVVRRRKWVRVCRQKAT